MSLTNAIIEEEIQTIESIFPDDVQREISTAKAWKGASMPPSFTLRVASDDPELEQHVYLTLHVQYSKTYPTAPATFTIKAPMGGLSSDHLKTLTNEIQRKAKELARSKQEMVFDIRQLCVDFMNAHHTYQKPNVVKLEAKPTQSLATEMQVRAASAERAQKVKAALEADGQRQLEEERASRLAHEMKRDTQRREQKIRADQERKQARERFLDRSEQDDSVVKFENGGIKLEDGRTFNAVKILMHQNCVLGKISAVEPILDSPTPSACSVELDLHAFYFTPTYYSRSQVPITDLLRTTIAMMFDQTKKNGITCSELIAKFKEAARERPPSEADNGTVVGSNGTGCPEGENTRRSSPRSPVSPVAPVRHTADYFYPSGSVSSLSMPPPRTSRYKEEWEEIEFLVKKIKLRGENDGKIYREVNALSRLNHRFIVRYHTTWIESTGVTGWESPTESGESSTAEITNGVTNGINGTSKPGRRRNGPIFRRDLSLDDGSFSGSLNTTTSFPSIRFGHSDDGASDEEADDDAETEEQDDEEEEEEEEEEEDDEEDGNLTESVYPRSKSTDGKKTFLVGNGTSSEDDTPSNSRAPSRRSMSKRAKSPKTLLQSPFARAPQIIFGSQEYVERQTLKEAIEDGITEKDCWRLFRQILEAVAHIASLGIIHRDIKLTNIFIGANGDVKIGDFGLATSSLAGIDPSDLSKTAFQPNLEITYGVGTALYTAPEVLSRARGNANHSKADMYSLGIVFFEMCWPPFQTSSERIEVLTKLRMPAIIFPDTWQDKERQRTIINKLLQHNPAQRPSALELSNSSLLPEQEEDAYFEEARRKIHNSDEQCETFISELFQKKFDDVQQLSYDIGATPAEYSSLNDTVQAGSHSHRLEPSIITSYPQEHMEQLFRLHGAVHKEPLILVPLTEVFDDEQQPVKLLDSAGRAVSLPRDLIVGFARLAVPSKDIRTPLRVKRFHVGNVYLPSPTGKQPIPRLMAVVDIIHTDSAAGAAEAELIRIVNEGLNIFPGVNTHQYEVLVSHSHIIDHLFNRIADRGRRRDVVLVLSQAKAFSQKRPQLLKLGLPRMLIDEMEILSEDIALKASCINDDFFKVYGKENVLKDLSMQLKPRAPNRDHVTYKVKSILRNTETEVPLQEIAPWLTSQIAEQRRADQGTSGSKGTLLTSSSVGAPVPLSSRDTSSVGGPAVQVIVAGDSYNKKFQRHKAKMHHAERAYAIESELRTSITSGLPVIGVEATGRALEVMTRDTAWLTSDAAWKVLTAELKDDLPPTVALHLREAILAKKAPGEGAGKTMVGLMSLKEERVFMIRV
ncbi:hypothetical protein M407DRAFT_226587 [Tulasnella calospora MUT 4182]|uniref:non-specific serine/threonine protein kinase n=1 Tax=Tulasnella calospora MUT 4182 TaxID=1051891 RepID=A0A0C3QNN4_9AGAM|nr:hypothetical protein M407DRAFT_226587 [Tulasnella calospora MUT 4182]